MTREKPIRAERRHSIRINASFLVELVGVDDRPMVRRGNISISGIYFEFDREVGPPGSVCRLRVAASEGGQLVDSMTRVVRVVSVKDLWKGSVVAGVAFEFMPQNEQQRADIGRLIKEAAELQIRRARGLQVDYPFDTRVNLDDRDRQEARLRNLNLEGMTLETDWPVKIGESIHLVIEAPESKRQIRLDGKVTSSEEIPEEGQTRYAHQVQFQEDKPLKPSAPSTDPAGGTLGFSITDAVDSLLAEIITTHPDAPRVDPTQPFCGRLSQVTLPSLLGFFENERVSGTLKLEQKGRRASLFIRQGRVIDIASDTPGDSVWEELAESFSWEDAIFDFNSEVSGREDRIGLSTAELLARLAGLIPDTTSE